jgi:hypothetical protein
MRFANLVVASAMLTGCTSTYTQNTLVELNTKMMRGKTVAISTPANGTYNGKPYIASGNMTAQVLKAAFANFSSTTDVVSECRDLPCLKGLSPRTYDYYAIPDILHWEDRNTEWSGIPDKVEVKISVYEGLSFKELASAIVSGKSKWATFGGDHPQDLLPEPMGNFVESLY